MSEQPQPTREEATADLLESSITKAMLLDPERIEDIIRDTAGPSLGGSGEPVSGGGIGNPTMNAALRPIIAADNIRERWERDVIDALEAGTRPPPRPAMPRPSDDLADIPKLHRAVRAFIDAGNRIWSACDSGPIAEDWDDAVKGLDMLCQTGTILTALDVGTKITGAIYTVQEAVLTVQRIHDGHCPHAPDMLTRTMEAKSGCRSCARIGVDTPRSTRLLCRSCWRDVQDLGELGEPVELQTDPNNWSSLEMLRARADGRRVDLMRERQAWLRGHGVDPRTAGERGRRRAS